MTSIPHPTFADAESEWDEADIILFGVAFDLTASFRSGAKFAPDTIRAISWNLESYVFHHVLDLVDLNVHDAGNIDETVSLGTMLADVERMAASILKKGAFPIAIGGDHSITPGIVKAMHDYYGEALGVITIDAHMDFRESYLNEKNSHACTTRRISDLVGVENVVAIGVRSCSKEEMADAEKLGLTYVSAFDVREKGIAATIENVLANLNKERIYLTFDIDGLDPAYAPGTGTPEPFGLTDYDALALIDAVAGRLVGFDLVEVCPPYDNGNTSSLAATFIKEVICASQRKKSRKQKNIN